MRPTKPETGKPERTACFPYLESDLSPLLSNHLPPAAPLLKNGDRKNDRS